MPRITILAVLLLCGFVAGCGSNDVVVSGVVLKNGASCSSDPNDQVMVTFIEQAAKDPKMPRRYSTRVDPAGAFQLKGPDGNGIPAGKYIVAASNLPMVPVKGQPMGDRFRGAFSEEKTPWTAEVTSAQRVFSFDVDKR